MIKLKIKDLKKAIIKTLDNYFYKVKVNTKKNNITKNQNKLIRCIKYYDPCSYTR